MNIKLKLSNTYNSDAHSNRTVIILSAIKIDRTTKISIERYIDIHRTSKCSRAINCNNTCNKHRNRNRMVLDPYS